VGPWQESRLTFVDLAGSERLHRAAAGSRSTDGSVPTGLIDGDPVIDRQALAEARDINSSLTALGTVVSALAAAADESGGTVVVAGKGTRAAARARAMMS